MKKNLYTSLCLFASALILASCSDSSVEVASVNVPAGADFSICLEEPVDTAKATDYYYSITFVTKDNFRYTRDGALTSAAAGSDRCYTSSKLQYDTAVYSNDAVAAIQRINNSTLDSCFVTIYNDPYLGGKNFVSTKTFSAEDFNK